MSAFACRSPRTLARLAAAVLLLAVTGCSEPPPAEIPALPEHIDDLDLSVADLVRESTAALKAEPRSPERWADLAMAYHANEVFDRAAMAYAGALTLRPEEPVWWYLLSRVEDRQGNDQASLEALTRTIELDESYGPAHWRRGDWRLDYGELEAAEADFRKAMEIDPKDPSAHIGMARLHIERGEGREAAEILETVVAKLPDENYAHLLLGNAYRQLGRMEDARRELEQGEGEYLVRNDPWLAKLLPFQVGFSARVLRAVRMLNGGRVDAAVEILTALREERPDDARVLTKLGNGYIKQGRIDESLEVLNDALARHPDHHKVHLELASALALSGDLQTALTHIDRSIELKQAQALAHARRAVILERLDRHAEAAEAYRTMLQYDPGNWRALLALGDCEARMERWDRAAESYAELVRTDEKAPELRARLGLALLNLGRLNEAEIELRRSLQLGTRKSREVGLLLGELERRRARRGSR
jgi:Flp pilus assembly protein TadD